MKVFKFSKIIFLFYLVFFSISYLSSSVEVRQNFDEEVENVDIGCVSGQCKDLFDVLIDMMRLCDDYLDFWQGKSNSMKLRLWLNNDTQGFEDIDKKILLLQEKKIGYAQSLGKLFRVAEPFIQDEQLSGIKDQKNIDKLQVEARGVICKIIAELSFKNYKDNEIESLQFSKPPRDFRYRILKYSFATVGTIAGCVILYKQRRAIRDYIAKFWKENIVAPCKNINSYFRNQSLIPIDIAPDECEAQREIIKDKIKDLVLDIDPNVKKDILGGVIEHASKTGLERFVHHCVKKAVEIQEKNPKKYKKSWLQWFLGGRLFNVSPKTKILELEIKGLITRLKVTEILIDAKNTIDDNRLTIILASLAPVAIVGYLSYKIRRGAHRWSYDYYRNKKQIETTLLKIGELLICNLDKGILSCEDQGFLCYYLQKLRNSISAVDKKKIDSFERFIKVLESCSNTIDKKFKTLQYVNFMLYS